MRVFKIKESKNTAALKSEQQTIAVSVEQKKNELERAKKDIQDTNKKEEDSKNKLDKNLELIKKSKNDLKKLDKDKLDKSEEKVVLVNECESLKPKVKELKNDLLKLKEDFKEEEESQKEKRNLFLSEWETEKQNILDEETRLNNKNRKISNDNKKLSEQTPVLRQTNSDLKKSIKENEEKEVESKRGRKNAIDAFNKAKKQLEDKQNEIKSNNDLVSISNKLVADTKNIEKEVLTSLETKKQELSEVEKKALIWVKREERLNRLIPEVDAFCKKMGINANLND